MRVKATGLFAGRGGLKHTSIGERDEVEVAYALLPQYWGQGLATELAVASVRAGFEVLHRPDLVCFTLTTNRASQRVMEKVGFRYERDVILCGAATRVLSPHRVGVAPQSASSHRLTFMRSSRRARVMRSRKPPSLTKACSRSAELLVE